MKLGCVEIGGVVRAVAFDDGGLVDLTELMGVSPRDLPRLGVVGSDAQAQAERAVAGCRTRITYDPQALKAPVPGDKIVGVGMNYHSFLTAARKAGMTIPAERLWFLRPPACLTGAYSDVIVPHDAADLDYETELAVVIGQTCREVSVAEAPAVVAGYTVSNDLSLRGRVAKSMVFAKCFETHTPLGPWIVTPDEAGDPHALALETWVNGERRQVGSTADMVGDCFELISELSHFCTLNPGDVILTGTPDGSGVFHKPAAMLRPGDVVRSVIEGLGEMENRMVAEPAAVAVESTPSPVLATGSDGRR